MPLKLDLIYTGFSSWFNAIVTDLAFLYLVFTKACEVYVLNELNSKLVKSIILFTLHLQRVIGLCAVN